jgi:hypothetical protein
VRDGWLRIAGATTHATFLKSNGLYTAVVEDVIGVLGGAITSWNSGVGTNPVAVLRQGAKEFPSKHCQIYLNATQTVPNITVTKILFDTVESDPNSWADVVTNHRITPKNPGRYRVTVNIAMSATLATTGARLDVYIYKNGANAGGQSMNQYTQGANYPMQVSRDVTLNGTDYIEGFAYFNTTGTNTVVAGAFNSWLTLDYVGP